MDVLDKVEAFEVGGADYITKLLPDSGSPARVEHQLRLHHQGTIIAAARALAERLANPADQLAAFAEALACDAGVVTSADQLAAYARTIQFGLPELARLTASETS